MIASETGKKRKKNQSKPSLIAPGMHHERCECGHCRCQHTSGFEGCQACRKCIRYTWPGRGADLPADHLTGTRPPHAPHALWDADALRTMGEAMQTRNDLQSKALVASPTCPECQATVGIHWEGWRGGWWCGPCGAEWPCGCQIKRTANFFGIAIPLNAFALSHGMVSHEILYCAVHALGPSLINDAALLTVGRAGRTGNAGDPQGASGPTA